MGGSYEPPAAAYVQVGLSGMIIRTNRSLLVQSDKLIVVVILFSGAGCLVGPSFLS